MDRKKSLLGKAGLLLAALFWGIGYLINKLSVQSAAPTVILWYKFAIATVCLGAIRARHLKTCSTKFLLVGALLGALLYLASLAQTEANHDTTAGKVAFITTTYIVWVPVMQWLFWRKKLRANQIAGVGVALVGLALLSVDKLSEINRGDLLVLAASLMHAGIILLTARFVVKEHPADLALMQYASGFVCASIALVADAQPAAALALSGALIWKVLYMGLFGVMGGFLLQSCCLKYVQPNQAAILMSTQSVIGMALSVAFGFEQLSGKLVVACALMVLAIVLTEHKANAA